MSNLCCRERQIKKLGIGRQASQMRKADELTQGDALKRITSQIQCSPTWLLGLTGITKCAATGIKSSTERASAVKVRVHLEHISRSFHAFRNQVILTHIICILYASVMHRLDVESKQPNCEIFTVFFALDETSGRAGVDDQVEQVS